MSWQLEYRESQKSLAEWELSAPTRRLISAEQDIVTVRAPARSATDAPIFAYGETVKILKDGAQWFVGIVISTDHDASAQDEGQTYTLAGPWNTLDQLVFQQPWYALIGTGFVTQYTSHVFLCLTGGVLLTAADQITRVLQFAISQGADFQIGTIEGNVYPPPREERDITCAEAIRTMLRFLPDSVIWFDYSTATPTIHCRPRSSLAAATVAIPSADDQSNLKLNAWSITPLPDLVRDVVLISYEIRGENDGEPTFALSRDIYPPSATGLEIGAMIATVDLQGVQISRLRGTLVADAIQADSIAWWKSMAPQLADGHIRNVEFIGTPAERTGTLNLPNRLIEGQVADWMDVQAEKERITVDVMYDVYDAEVGGKWVDRITLQTISVDLTSTDSDVGEVDYATVDSAEAGDPIPVGLAQYLQSKLSVLQYQGSMTFVQSEIGGTIGIGSVVNISGGRPEWTTMNALVQQVQEDIDNGVTRIQFGPPAQLGVPDLVELLRVGRIRKRYSRQETQDDGDIGNASEIQLGKNTANDNGQSGPTQKSLQTVQHPTGAEIKQDAPNKSVTIIYTNAGVTKQVLLNIDDLSGVVGAPANLNARFRETTICELIAGVPTSRKCMVLRTETW